VRGLVGAAGLAVIWVLLWGSASPANVLSGMLVGALLVLAVPGLRRRGRLRIPFRPLAIARFAGHVAFQVVVSNVVLTREVVTPRSRIRTGVIGVPLPGCSAELITLINNVVALTPGTMPLEVTQDPTVLYVHVLHLENVEEVRRDILHLTSLAVRAFGTKAAMAALEDPP
jgi:multicomponent Na+:H+ antiporter subunit E